ncbi:hypothetical protein K431DRAFT_3589 [Polychaeton citri CBS 116435]|uniref:Uncharacterized protein n=1 Tax=Polychaeton citri CBS 116435 TaxID=1314669 RepID=A0A9P4QF91_9PEZI|nr:hypothetical protein K431DRAFT_3589 [Polychaeton citri CBS 116435]
MSRDALDRRPGNLICLHADVPPQLGLLRQDWGWRRAIRPCHNGVGVGVCVCGCLSMEDLAPGDFYEKAQTGHAACKAIRSSQTVSRHPLASTRIVAKLTWLDVDQARLGIEVSMGSRDARSKITTHVANRV